LRSAFTAHETHASSAAFLAQKGHRSLRNSAKRAGNGAFRFGTPVAYVTGMKKTIYVIAILAIVMAAGAAWHFLRPRTASTSAVSYELTSVTKGSIERIVSSSGTLAPVSEVSVLPQMSGRVEKVLADYNQRVKKGQVLAQINTDVLKLQQKEAQAAVKKAQANYDLNDLNYQNKAVLYQKGLLAEYDYKSAQANREVHAADLASAKSALDVIETELNQYAIVTSPIDGIVINRNVDVGQSVVDGSSANAASLFTLAGDLSQMEIKAEVDELDIASIKVRQEVRFTVEANPLATYAGSVRQIRLVPNTSDNVVSYYVMISASNKDGTLLPGMTANVQFITQKKDDVLTVPSAAFRFHPSGLSSQQIARMEFLADTASLPEDQRKAAEAAYDQQIKAAATTSTRSTGLVGMMLPGRPPGATSSGSTDTAGALAGSSERKTLWYMGGDGKLAVARVTVGSTDGSRTELVAADDLLGVQIVLKVKEG
jgi:HlyD family secretion protein